MKFRGTFFLVWRGIVRNAARNIIHLATLALVAFFLCLALLVHFGVRKPLLNALGRAFPEKKLLALPRTLDLGPIRLNRTRLTGKILDQISALPGVVAVYPMQPVVFPVSAEGTILGQELFTDVIVNGVAPELVLPDVAPGWPYPDSPDGTWQPVLISKYFLDIYNFGMAQSMSLPKFNEAKAIGQDFTLVLGESIIAADSNTGETRRIACRVVGFTPDVNLLGIIVPLEIVRTWNEQFEGQSRDDFTRAYVEVRNVHDMETVITGIRALGLDIESRHDLARQFRFMLDAATALTAALLGAVLFLAALGLAQSEYLTLLVRKGEIGLMRASGATRAQILLLHFSEKIIVGIMGGIVGAGTFALLGVWASERLGQVLSGVSFLEGVDDSLRIKPGMIAAAVAFAALWNILISIPVMAKTLGSSPSRLMRE
ncbi:MAG TPA: ABC transporter permease [Candidatus Sumerlaeota bacterium]|nr:ABC transporter permease [Candidatus Sumerlaeota bacterium]